MIEHQNILNYFENIQNKLGFNINNIEENLKEAQEKSKDYSIFSSNKTRKYYKDLYNFLFLSK